MKKAYFHYSFIGVLIICVSAVLISCDTWPGGEEGAPGVKGQTASITLAADPTSILADGSSSSAITATLKDSAGKAVSEGTSVTFSTTLGTFLNGSTGYSMRTADSSGVAVASLRAGTTPGTAKVTVVSIGVSQTVSVVFTGAGQTASITLKPDPTSIAADGSSSCSITATLTDSAGSAVSTGTSVTFSTTLGTFANDSTSYTVTTTDNLGIITVSLISGTASGTAVVTAESDSVTQAVEVEFTAHSVSRVGSISLGDDFSMTTDGTTVTFVNNTNYGTLSASSAQTSGGAAPVSGTPAAISLTSSSDSMNPGETGTGATATIQVVYRNICESYGCDPFPIPANGFSSIHIKAMLTDGSGEPVYAWTSVTFSTTLGHFPGGATSYSVETIDDSGIVEVSLIAGTTSGVAFITCSSNSVTQADYTVFTDWEAIDVIGSTASITLEAEPTSIPADGSSSTTITATLTDCTGEPVTMGTYVSFHTDSGRFPNNSVTYTTNTPDETGIVMVSLIASTTVEDAKVCANSNAVSQCITVEFTDPEEEEE